MTEIIPSIENQWMGLNKQKNLVATMIDINKTPIKQIIYQALRATDIVFTCFTPELAQLAVILRTKLHFYGRYFFYAHGMSAVVFWPFHQWGISKILYSSDYLISSSSRDADNCALAYKEINIIVLPFLVKKITCNKEPKKESYSFLGSGQDFVYVGRISSQKNLHTMIYTFYLFKKKFKKTFRLHLFGDEDNLGSPNMGAPNSGYLIYLQNLVHKLNLHNQVSFHGFMQRDELETILSNNIYHFISPSLHGDENFGMAACRSLSSGNHAILSDWGGHADFIKTSKSEVTLIPVYSSITGPYICPHIFCTFIENIYFLSTADKILGQDQAHEDFFTTLGTVNNTNKQIVTLSALSQTIWHRWKKQHNNKSTNATVKIFKNYSDPLFHMLAKAYGAKKREKQSLNSTMFLVPWVNRLNNSLEISDPHRGDRLYMLRKSHNTVIASTVTGDELKISISDAQQLYNLGYLHY